MHTESGCRTHWILPFCFSFNSDKYNSLRCLETASIEYLSFIVLYKLFDSISVEMQCISTSAHLYFYSLLQQSGAGPGGGTAPSNPPNNIIGGALGLFSAHSSQTKVVKILNK